MHVQVIYRLVKCTHSSFTVKNYVTVRQQHARWLFARLAPVSNVNIFSKTDNLSKMAIYKLYYLEAEIVS